MKSLLTKITILETIDYKDIVFILSLVNKYINTLHSRVHISFVYHCNNNWLIGNADDYRPNPCMVEKFGGMWIAHYHALSTFKGWKPYSLVICLWRFRWPTGYSVWLSWWPLKAVYLSFLLCGSCMLLWGFSTQSLLVNHTARVVIVCVLALGLSKVSVQFSCGSSRLVKIKLVDTAFPSGLA